MYIVHVHSHTSRMCVCMVTCGYCYICICQDTRFDVNAAPTTFDTSDEHISTQHVYELRCGRVQIIQKKRINDSNRIVSFSLTKPHTSSIQCVKIIAQVSQNTTIISIILLESRCVLRYVTKQNNSKNSSHTALVICLHWCVGCVFAWKSLENHVSFQRQCTSRREVAKNNVKQQTDEQNTLHYMDIYLNGWLAGWMHSH